MTDPPRPQRPPHMIDLPRKIRRLYAEDMPEVGVKLAEETRRVFNV